tara:strand:- start:2298 stop:3200 length:903 start_codon:yes stop_codon:yes gene_type:complete
MVFITTYLKKFLIFLIESSDKLNKSKSISYTLFDYFYLKKIKKHSFKKLNSLIELGYYKLDNKFTDFVETINNRTPHLKLKKDTKYLKIYETDTFIEDRVDELCNDNLRETINDLSNLYMSNIYLANIKIAQNFHFEENVQKYSNFFHVDNNRCTLFKIFISLENIKYDQGPTQIIPNNKKDKFLKRTNYINRYNYDQSKKDFDIYQNISSKGDALICNTSRCYHKAGVPQKNKSRKMMTLSFVAYPKVYGKYHHLDFLKNQELSQMHEKNFINYLSKSRDIFDNYKIYKDYEKFKSKNF